MAIYKNSLDTFILITKALSDPQRVRIIAAIQNQELCLCQVVALLHLAQSTVSKHVSILKQAGLVVSRKQERWNYFRLPDNPPLEIKNALEWTLQSANGTERIKTDKKKLKKINSISKEKLCQNQKS